jgi:hypothetical protein
MSANITRLENMYRLLNELMERWNIDVEVAEMLL